MHPLEGLGSSVNTNQIDMCAFYTATSRISTLGDSLITCSSSASSERGSECQIPIHQKSVSPMTGWVLIFRQLEDALFMHSEYPNLYAYI